MPTPMTARSEVASASTCASPRMSASAGTNRMPPPTPRSPPVKPPARPRAAAPMTSCASISEDQQPRRDDEQDGEGDGHRAFGDALLERCAGHAADQRGAADDQCLERMDVAVQGLEDGARRGDENDRHERRAGRLALAVAEPEDQQRHDYGPAADAEKT